MDIAAENMLEGYLRNIHKLCTSGMRVYIYGVNENSRALYRRLKKEDIIVSGFVKDKSDAVQNNTFQGIRILDVEELKKKDKNLLLTNGIINDELIKELNDFSACEIKNLPTEDYMPSVNKIQQIKKFTDRIAIYLQAFKLYSNMIKRYHAKKVFVFSGQSGDLFNALVYMGEYLKKANLVNDYVLTVIGGACLKVAQMFNLCNVEKISETESEKLISLYELCGEKSNIVPVHCSERIIKNTVITKLDRHKNITLGKMYKYQIFRLNEDSCPQLPVYIRNSQYIDEVFKSNQWVRGRTVLLSPYANSYMDDELMKDWENLSKWLIENNYTVLTNSIGENEPPIPGTKAIGLPLEYVVDFIEQGGFFIGLRSGLCDIISGALCVKIILYREDFYGRGDYFTFHCLKNMQLCDDAYEIKYGQNNKNEVFKGIRQYFPQQKYSKSRSKKRGRKK